MTSITTYKCDQCDVMLYVDQSPFTIHIRNDPARRDGIHRHGDQEDYHFCSWKCAFTKLVYRVTGKTL